MFLNKITHNQKQLFNRANKGKKAKRILMLGAGVLVAFNGLLSSISAQEFAQFSPKPDLKPNTQKYNAPEFGSNSSSSTSNTSNTITYEEFKQGITPGTKTSYSEKSDETIVEQYADAVRQAHFLREQDVSSFVNLMHYGGTYILPVSSKYWNSAGQVHNIISKLFEKFGLHNFKIKVSIIKTKPVISTKVYTRKGYISKIKKSEIKSPEDINKQSKLKGYVIITGPVSERAIKPGAHEYKIKKIETQIKELKQYLEQNAPELLSYFEKDIKQIQKKLNEHDKRITNLELETQKLNLKINNLIVPEPSEPETLSIDELNNIHAIQKIIKKQKPFAERARFDVIHDQSKQIYVELKAPLVWGIYFINGMNLDSDKNSNNKNNGSQFFLLNNKINYHKPSSETLEYVFGLGIAFNKLQIDLSSFSSYHKKIDNDTISYKQIISFDGYLLTLEGVRLRCSRTFGLNKAWVFEPETGIYLPVSEGVANKGYVGTRIYWKCIGICTGLTFKAKNGDYSIYPTAGLSIVLP